MDYIAEWSKTMWPTAAERTILEHDLAARADLERIFDRLLAENGPALSRLAASYTNTAADRDDLVQEIALSIWRGLPQFRGECSERTFIFRIAHNRAVTHLTRRPPATSEVVDVAIPRRIRKRVWRVNSRASGCAWRSTNCRCSTVRW